MQRTIITILILASCALCSCNSTRKKSVPMTRTISYPGGATLEGAANAPAGVGAVVVETPYESPAYKAAGEAMFSRP